MNPAEEIRICDDLRQAETEAGVLSLRELKSMIRDDWRVNDRSWMRPGCQTMVVYRIGVWSRSLRPWVLRAPFRFMHGALQIFIRNFYGIELPSTARIGRRLRIAHQSGIIVHPHAVMGDNCLIRQGVSIGSASGRELGEPPVLGNRVEVGAGAIVLDGVVVGDDVIIGPAAVVSEDVPSRSIAACAPARIFPRPGSTEPVPATEAKSA